MAYIVYIKCGLTPDVLEELQRIADEERRSISNISALLIESGIAERQRKLLLAPSAEGNQALPSDVLHLLV